MLLYACSYGQYIGVKYYFIRFEAGFFHKQPECTGAHLYFPFVCSGLALLVECHDNNDCTQTLCFARMLYEKRFTLLERY